MADGQPSMVKVAREGETDNNNAKRLWDGVQCVLMSKEIDILVAEIPASFQYIITLGTVTLFPRICRFKNM